MSEVLKRFELVIPGNPPAKMRPQISAPRAGHRPRTHQAPKDKAHEDTIRQALQIAVGPAEVPLFTGCVSVLFMFFRSSRQVVDLDNLEKSISDAGNGILWKDDSQIVYKQSWLELDRGNPRTVVVVLENTTSTMLRGTSFANPKEEY